MLDYNGHLGNAMRRSRGDRGRGAGRRRDRVPLAYHGTDLVPPEKKKESRLQALRDE